MTDVDQNLRRAVEDSTATQRRKGDHIRINLEQDVYGQGTTTGFERYRLVHNALPELSLAEVRTETTFLGHRLDAPILVSSMTGGTPEARDILRNLAAAAEKARIAIGIGSQRAAVEDGSLSEFYDVRDIAPTIPIFANIGAVQLNYGIGIDGCRRAVEMVRADALILHLNPIQEAVQAEGNHDFSNLLHKIGEVCASLDVPVIVKEVGFGLSADVARRLAEQGVAALDASGAGGTSWSAVEAHRAATPLQRSLGEAFSDWGIPTADSLLMMKSAAPDLPLIASGGLRDGVDGAKALAMGADLVGYAGPLLHAATEGEEQVLDVLTTIREQIKLAMFGTGTASVRELRHAPIMTADGAMLASR